MASEYVRLHIMKHALEYYVKREGASEKDISQEKKVLNGVAEELENLKILSILGAQVAVR